MWWCNLVLHKNVVHSFPERPRFLFYYEFYFSAVTYYEEVFNFKLFVNQKLKTIGKSASDANYLTPSYFFQIKRHSSTVPRHSFVTWH